MDRTVPRIESTIPATIRGSETDGEEGQQRTDHLYYLLIKPHQSTHSTRMLPNAASMSTVIWYSDSS